ncbi:hypothetical protein pb186bvf_017515 [Paramecium bursaria]
MIFFRILLSYRQYIFCYQKELYLTKSCILMNLAENDTLQQNKSKI